MANGAEVIRKLETAMPIMNENVKKQQEAARAIQLQKSVASAPTPVQGQPVIAPQARAIGEQQAAIGGQQQIDAAKDKQNKLSQLTESAKAAEEQKIKQELGVEQLGLNEKKLVVETALKEHGREIEDKIFKAQTELKRDAMNNVVYQENQKMDLAIETAKSEEDLKDRLQSIEQASDQDIQIMRALSNRLNLILQKNEDIAGQRLDQQSQEKIIEYKNYLDKKARDKEAEAKNKAAMYKAGGTIIGAGVGAAIGGPGGYAAGAAAGGAIGGAAGGLLA